MIYNDKGKIFTKREIKVVEKKLKHKRLSPTDSNYLYRFVRPKLREIASIDAKNMLDKMEYNQKIEAIENKIKRAVLSSIKEVDSIIIYGSVIQNNYKDYNDIDILIVTKIKIYDKLGQKYKKIKELREILQRENINADIQIYDKKTIEYSYIHSPTLIYELKDSKIIYGMLKIPDKNRVIYNMDLRMKLSWSDIKDTYSNGNDIYKALRNILVIKLILNKIVDNRKLNESLNDEFGKSFIKRLKNNCESRTDRRIALLYLKELLEKTREDLRGDLWEKIEL